uniref:Collagen IV NC1 domain-containing protein n=1 Tax=Macrostomum lignano TaxID=282301 RepID=A0A1I8FP35_9PLAT
GQPGLKGLSGSRGQGDPGPDGIKARKATQARRRWASRRASPTGTDGPQRHRGVEGPRGVDGPRRTGATPENRMPGDKGEGIRGDNGTQATRAPGDQCSTVTLRRAKNKLLNMDQTMQGPKGIPRSKRESKVGGRRHRIDGNEAIEDHRRPGMTARRALRAQRRRRTVGVCQALEVPLASRRHRTACGVGEKGLTGPAGPQGARVSSVRLEQGPAGRHLQERLERREGQPCDLRDHAVKGRRKGDQGPKGPTGDRGYKGDKGRARYRGNKGVKGGSYSAIPAPPDRWATRASTDRLSRRKGDKGDAGQNGECRVINCTQGEKGDMGPKGWKGDKGQPAGGAAGRERYKGYLGPQETKAAWDLGLLQETGYKGVTGDRGLQGDDAKVNVTQLSKVPKASSVIGHQWREGEKGGGRNQWKIGRKGEQRRKGDKGLDEFPARMAQTGERRQRREGASGGPGDKGQKGETRLRRRPNGEGGRTEQGGQRRAGCPGKRGLRRDREARYRTQGLQRLQGASLATRAAMEPEAIAARRATLRLGADKGVKRRQGIKGDEGRLASRDARTGVKADNGQSSETGTQRLEKATRASQGVQRAIAPVKASKAAARLISGDKAAAERQAGWECAKGVGTEADRARKGLQDPQWTQRRQMGTVGEKGYQATKVSKAKSTSGSSRSQRRNWAAVACNGSLGPQVRTGRMAENGQPGGPQGTQGEVGRRRSSVRKASETAGSAKAPRPGRRPGPFEATGRRGTPGPVWSEGSGWSRGPAGDVGPRGPKGDGLPGPQGDKGDVGPLGEKGELGPLGPGRAITRAFQGRASNWQKGRQRREWHYVATRERRRHKASRAITGDFFEGYALALMGPKAIRRGWTQKANRASRRKGVPSDAKPVGRKGDKGGTVTKAKLVKGRERVKGDVGEKGDTGFQRRQRRKRHKGDLGPKGTKGDLGDKGFAQNCSTVIGPEGEKGSNAQRGERRYGFEGSERRDRSQRPQRTKGSKATWATKATTGPKGDAGQKGEKGRDASHGIDAQSRRQGERGPQGRVGPKGELGETGRRTGCAAKGGERDCRRDTGLNKGENGTLARKAKRSKATKRQRREKAPEVARREERAKRASRQARPKRRHRTQGDVGPKAMSGRKATGGPRGDRGKKGSLGPKGIIVTRVEAARKAFRGQAAHESGRLPAHGLHSMSDNAPDCPPDTKKVRMGYSFCSMDPARRSFTSMPFIYCDSALNCHYSSRSERSYWLSTRTAMLANPMPVADPQVMSRISRCTVCDSPTDLIAVHSQSNTHPDCPTGWGQIWIGYSFLMEGCTYEADVRGWGHYVWGRQDAPKWPAHA